MQLKSIHHDVIIKVYSYFVFNFNVILELTIAFFHSCRILGSGAKKPLIYTLECVSDTCSESDIINDVIIFEFNEKYSKLSDTAE